MMIILYIMINCVLNFVYEVNNTHALMPYTLHTKVSTATKVYTSVCLAMQEVSYNTINIIIHTHITHTSHTCT